MPGKHKNRRRKSYRDPTRPSGKRLSDRERTQILTLWSVAGWNRRQIAERLRLAYSTVCDCIMTGILTPHKPIGRPPNLTTHKRKRLIERATLNAQHRRMIYEEIAELEGITACRRTLIKAFEKEQYHRRSAQEKPFLTPENMTIRLQWAYNHRSWDIAMWSRVCWTDAASFTTGGFSTVFVTRTAEEKFHPHCLIPKFAKQGYSACMAYASISGIAKGNLLLLDKAWGKVNSQIYVDRVLPDFYGHLRLIEQHVGFMRSILMEDGASIHTSRFTRSYHAYRGAIRMLWPPHSPDLNPIENVWRLLKYRIGKRYPKNEQEVRQYLIEEWDKITQDDFMKYIESMPARCQAVIDAQGGHTKW